MKRREFIKLIGGSVATAWPLAAGAQQKKSYRIGVLSQDLQPGLLETFRDELQKRGYVEGRDIASSCGMRPDTMSGCPRWRTTF